MVKRKKKKGFAERVESWGKERIKTPKKLFKKKKAKRLTIRLANL